MRALQDGEARHKPCRQRRLAGRVGVNLAQFALDERPVDQTAKPYEFVSHVENLVEPCPEQIILPGYSLFKDTFNDNRYGLSGRLGLIV